MQLKKNIYFFVNKTKRGKYKALNLIFFFSPSK